ncbi:MarR family winged helix-turn-helix transcriptional regulator [Kribbella italica]|uniref:DNA-binding MarR family transcriptional regulator n=1 Tax=Kribbella italica TaxID=1540520 RepID=A0A7W9JFC1_9ACTN|nr:MarR family transcriptional regulator [Kribbella italica]MBB5840478.1 DNA-binding MarR family transcriptional regulator [Kribbella italica]
MERDDLGALLARVVRRLMTAERPLLDAHGLSMWGYSVLTHLAKQPTETQQALAQAIGYDKSRLIPLLDQLAEDGLLVREPDPANRRAHTVRLTPEGRTRLNAAKADIRAMEDDLLSALSATEKRHLLAALPRLAEAE